MAQQIIIKGTAVVAANEVLVADSNSKIPAVDGSAVTAMAGGNITGTIPTARLDTGTTANKLVVIGGSGLPAVDGSLLTGIVSHTTSASDPTISTNPSSGVGAEWINSTSGKQFICTDATAGANVWTCSGGGSGNVQPYWYQGSAYGYVCGGYEWPAPGNRRDPDIDEFSFSTDGNATDVGDIPTGNPGRSAGTTNSSPTHLHYSGGYGPGAFTPNTTNNIERMSFVSKGTMVNVGDLVHWIRGQGSSGNENYGYQHGGYRAVSDPSGPATAYNVIWRFQYAASSNATDVGDLLNNADDPGGCSDPANAYGYSVGGCCPTNTIQRYAMVSSGNAADVGDLTVSHYQPASSSSLTHGYRSGNSHATPHTKNIDKFAFASTGNATDIGDLIEPASSATGQSSTTHGYSTGGSWAGGPYGQAGSKRIEKYSHVSNANATSVGDMTINRNTAGPVGGQV